MIKLATNLSLDKEVATKVFSFVAMRGAGKTYAASDLAEEMIKNDIPIIVLDPMGVWWGLKLSADLKAPGLPVVVFGGDHQDIPLEPANAEKMVRAIVETNINAVIDTSELSQGETQKFVIAFVNELRRINVEDRHIFLEEADVYAPQKPLGNETVMLHAIDQLVRRGGNRNLGCTMLTQRAAVLNKNVLTQSDFLVVLRTNAPQDKEAVKAWAMRRTSNKDAVNKWLDGLSDLKDGEAYVWGPDNNVPGLQVKFRERETFHATRQNLKLLDSAHSPQMDVSEFVDKYYNAFEPKKKKAPAPKLIEQPKLSAYAQATIPPLVSPKRTENVETPRGVPDVPRVASPEAMGFDPPSAHQDLPTIVIHQAHPALVLDVGIMDHPETTLGRLSVVLNEYTGKMDNLSYGGLEKELQERFPGTLNDDVRSVIDQLRRWGILTKNSRRMLTLDKSRIKVVQYEELVQAR